ncbi:MAG TPA: SDR family NAD(P)-dependent oxidoreductase [Candidatus Saccharimonadales bacterium]|nr:SDR family NAD(P)-dependent oxidoreductase [Candidatus Saccharimonadales bacterium]
MADIERPKVFITGSSRGIGAETAYTFASLGWDVAIGTHDKIRRAERVVKELGEMGAGSIVVAGDLGDARELEKAIDQVSEWAPRLSGLDLNAAIGLEDGVTEDDARHFNRDTQVELVNGLMPNLAEGSTVALVMSNWAQHYRDNIHMPPFERHGKTYDVVAGTKREGLEALEESVVSRLSEKAIKFVVVTAGAVEGTPVAEYGLRGNPDFARQERNYTTSAEHFGMRIAAAMVNPNHKSGDVIYVGGDSPEDFLSRWQITEGE